MKKTFLMMVVAGATVFTSLSVSAQTSATKKAKTAKTTGMEKKEGVMVGGALMVPSKNIVANALGSKDHTTLVAAVKAADLVETLMGTGPFTVFAPTNAAFNKLPAGTVETLLKPENKAKLTSVLTFHVVPGKLQAKDLKNGQKLKTVNGETLTVTRKGNMVMINGAHVSTADVISSNGVTHVIDTVVLPTM
ncbi:hypothetical protein TH63_02075 [Rufibacter radiotolerans]|uniref:FAS1 domain-containing protein n=1 Tax=Rufibacter radiotolerans TaxID=1379910 RepID=A0A0H4W2M2_9BACT|nr:hypothetical protein TH63_02075 [Rufibacter radiotolerans]